MGAARQAQFYLNECNVSRIIAGINMKWVWAALALLSFGAHATEAVLAIVSDQERRTFSQSQLLSRRDTQIISVADSVYKQRFTRFKAIPIASLFTDLAIPELAVVQCNAVDGFSTVFAKSRLFGAAPMASKAFLAIEDPKSPWPQLPGKTGSAGPFYLVWTNPQTSAIGPEEWPYAIASFEIFPDPRRTFPDLYPTANASRSVQNGFESFLKNCFACHKMNGNGAGSIGPDLNLPMNPTEYYDAKALVSLVRDPASVRTWSGMVMRGFSKAAISDAELSDLIDYLKYMSKKKHKPG